MSEWNNRKPLSRCWVGRRRETCALPPPPSSVLGPLSSAFTLVEMLAEIKKNGWNNVQLAPETTGKHSALGSLDETIRLAKETGCSLCVERCFAGALSMRDRTTAERAALRED